MPNPLIQIDDEIREMTDEETQEYLASLADNQPLTELDSLLGSDTPNL